MAITFAVFCVGLLIGWVSMHLFIFLTGNLRTRGEQEVYLIRKCAIKSGIPTCSSGGPCHAPGGCGDVPGLKHEELLVDGR